MCGGRSICPVRIGAERMVHEEVPGAVRALAMHLHAVMVNFDRLAVLVLAGDQPLRAGHGEVAGDGHVVGNDIHVRLQIDIGSHGRADSVGAARDGGTAVDIVHLDDCSVRMVERGCCLDILRIERARQPQIGKVRRGSTHGFASVLR